MKFFAWKKLKSSFQHAFQGLCDVFWEQQAFRIQIIISLFVLFLIFGIPLSSVERAVLFLTIFFTLSMEILNSIFEKTVDAFEPAINAKVKKIKDMMAGASLLLAIGCIIIGVLIFWPYARNLLGV
ncbi:MAG: diacylglycerol kinase family protein [Candidatus Nealsonbacteria bacterium]|nr:diacylglycerol kinase family protein [Candidatus Nealsonbacteria bacterium]